MSAQSPFLCSAFAGRVRELLRSQVCRSSDEVLDAQESWKMMMIAKGWQ